MMTHRLYLYLLLSNNCLRYNNNSDRYNNSEHRSRASSKSDNNAQVNAGYHRYSLYSNLNCLCLHTLLYQFTLNFLWFYVTLLFRFLSFLLITTNNYCLYNMSLISTHFFRNNVNLGRLTHDIRNYACHSSNNGNGINVVLPYNYPLLLLLFRLIGNVRRIRRQANRKIRHYSLSTSLFLHVTLLMFLTSLLLSFLLFFLTPLNYFNRFICRTRFFNRTIYVKLVRMLLFSIISFLRHLLSTISRITHRNIIMDLLHNFLLLKHTVRAFMFRPPFGAIRASTDRFILMFLFKRHTIRVALSNYINFNLLFRFSLSRAPHTLLLIINLSRDRFILRTLLYTLNVGHNNINIMIHVNFGRTLLGLFTICRPFIVLRLHRRAFFLHLLFGPHRYDNS